MNSDSDSDQEYDYYDGNCGCFEDFICEYCWETHLRPTEDDERARHLITNLLRLVKRTQKRWIVKRIAHIEEKLSHLGVTIVH